MRLKLAILLIALLNCVNALAQYGETTDDQKAKMLYQLPKYLIWENDDQITTIYIGVVNSDPDLFKTLRREARKPYSGTGTRVVVTDYVTVQDAANAADLNLLYTSYAPDCRKALEAFRNRPVAVVSDNYIDQRSIMINFVDEKSGLVSFKYSSANLRKAGISVHNGITKILHGEDLSKDDIIQNQEQRIKNTQNELSQKERELAAKQRQLTEKDNEIYEKEHTIEIQNRNIQNQTRAITEQGRRINEQKEEMEKLWSQQQRTREELEDAAAQLEFKNQEVNAVAVALQQQQIELERQQQMAQEQQAKIDKVNKEISDKENELKDLNLQNELLNNRLLIAWAAIIVFLLMLFFIAKLYVGKRRDNNKLEEQNIAISKANNEITRQKEEIATQNEKIIESIMYAQNIQRAVMPPVEFFEQFLPDHFILLKPRDIVSGDFYWGSQLGDKFIFTAADCTGHGVPGAFMSLLGIAFLNEIVGRMSPQTITAGEILTQLRNNVMTYLRQSGKEDEQKDGMDMALCIYDRKESKLQYAGANNPLLIIRNNEMIQIDPDEMPIGYYEGQADHFTNHEMDIHMGDMTYMFSDGYADQFGIVNGRKKKYLIKRFREFLMEIHNLDMDTQKQRLDDNLLEWRGELKQLDDVLVFGARF